MTLWVCSGESGCGTKYAVGLFRCPRCHNTQFHEDGQEMPKITVHGGASDATLPVSEPKPVAVEQADVVPAGEQAAAEESGTEVPSLPFDVTEYLAVTEPALEGGEESSPGSSSSVSTPTPPTVSEPSSRPRRKPARKTASHSGQGQTASSSAPTTGGGPTAPTSASDTSVD